MLNATCRATILYLLVGCGYYVLVPLRYGTADRSRAELLSPMFKCAQVDEGQSSVLRKKSYSDVLTTKKEHFSLFFDVSLKIVR